MLKSQFTKLLIAVAAFSFAITAPVFGQGVTTSSITGQITDSNGAPVAGAVVVVVNTATSLKATTLSRSNGAFDVSGLQSGGPYTISVSAKGELQSDSKSEIFVGLEHAEVVNFRLFNDVVKLEAFKVSESKDLTFDSGKMGTGSTFNRDQISEIPSIRRDVQDVANLDTRVGLTINTSTGEFSLSAQGQNSRFNSFLIDGQQANDPFGLNANGFSSLRSPVPLAALSALTIELSPYDVTRSGFTGALINAVTKSGTNEFHGTISSIYTGKSLRGPNPGQSATDPNAGIIDPLQEHANTFTFGGPIIKNKVFFFVAYDQYNKVANPSSPVTFVPSSADLASVLATATKYGMQPGAIDGMAKSAQKTYLAKLDWNITDDQRASLSYRRTAGLSPNFSNGSTYVQLDSNAYQSNRINDNLSLLLNSKWFDGFSSESGLAVSKYNGTASLYEPLAPAVYVNGVSGTNLVTGATLTNGQIDLGTNASYQFNALYTKDYNGHFYADYSMGDHTFKIGGDFDKNINEDNFIQYYTGLYGFASPAAFAAGTPNYIRYQQPVAGYTIPQANYYYSTTDFGLLAQDTWKPSASLTVTAGIRFDEVVFPTKPLYLPAFQSTFGMPNNTTPSGNTTLAPRLGFNYKLPKSLTIFQTQVRGGLGLFRGTNPAVWIGNSYGTTGILNSVISGASNSSNTNPPLAAPYAQFNASPGFVQTLPPPATPTPGIAFTDPKFQPPTSWKGNLAIDVTVPDDMVFTAETNMIKVQKGLFYQDINLKPKGFAPDGRVLYSGTAGLYSNFSNSVLELTNTDKGGSQSYTLQLARPMKNGWAYSVGYTHTHATEVQPLTSSVASSNFTSRATYNPNDATAVNSAYAVPNKVTAMLTRQLHLFKEKNSATRITAVYRAQAGHPFSWVFSGDANGDSTSGNDSFYVPAGPNDPKVTWSTNAADPTGSIQATNFWNFVNGTDLKKYQGTVVRANSSNNPMQKTLDLHIEQEIPVGSKFKVVAFADCINFANFFNSNWGIINGLDFGTGYSGYNRAVASATVNTAGQYVYTFNSSTLSTPIVFTDLSRWQVQAGARIEF